MNFTRLIRLSLFCSLTLRPAIGCSGDDDSGDSDSGGSGGTAASGATGGATASGGSGGIRPNDRYAGVESWLCWKNNDNSTCSCYGLEAGETLEMPDSKFEPIRACEYNAECLSFRDTAGDWVCACGPLAFLPDQDIGGDAQVGRVCPML